MSTALFDLSGKTALVTGSSRGIGFGIAKGLIEAGAKVVLNSRSQTDLDTAKSMLGDLGQHVATYAADVANPEQVTAMFADLEARAPIDILFNNAGIQHRAPLEDFPVERFDQLMRVNVNAAFYVGQQAAKYMIPRKAGRIINTCSLMSTHARQSIAPYTASKGAMAALTRGMTADWAKHGLNINGIGPGYFKTELNEALFNDAEFTRWLEARTPMQRWGETHELVGVAVFLASEASAFLNGQIIMVDGGLTSTI